MNKIHQFCADNNTFFSGWNDVYRNNFKTQDGRKWAINYSDCGMILSINLEKEVVDKTT